MAKVCIAGGRNIFFSSDSIAEVVRRSGVVVTELINGKARGIDASAESWANKHGIPVKPFPPDYEKYNSKIAPIKRNNEMAREADVLILIWNGNTPGSYNMGEQMRHLGKPIFQCVLTENNHYRCFWETKK